MARSATTTGVLMLGSAAACPGSVPDGVPARDWRGTGVAMAFGARLSRHAVAEDVLRAWTSRRPLDKAAAGAHPGHRRSAAPTV